MKKLLIALMVSVCAAAAHATDIAYSGTFVGTEGLASIPGGATAKTFTRDMNTTGNLVSMEITYSSYTVAVSTNFGSNNYVLNTPTITITSNGFTLGQQVLYTVGGSPAISGLSTGTTYYIVPLTPNTLGVSNSFKLASSLANAQAGTGIVLASSSTVTNRYTLAPLAFTNTTNGGIQIQWSDDKVNFVNATTANYAASISSVTFAIAGGTSLYDLGWVSHRYLRLNVTPATTGAVTYTATDNERYTMEGH